MVTPITIDRYITIDDEGYFSFDGIKVEDEAYGRDLLSNIRVLERNRLVTSLKGQNSWVEAFDAPFMAKHVAFKDGKTAIIVLPYNTKAEFTFNNLSVDEWDRFHGVTTKGIPFVFTRQGQVEFFELLDSFDDDSITVKGQQYPTEPWIKANPEVTQDGFWTNIYKNEEPGWEMHGVNPALPEILPQLKLSRAKILVLGCGSGHDAAFLAEAGHVVTAVDFSQEAINRATELYGKLENLSLVKADAFKLPDNWTARFDLILEHTCYCAISPDRRNDLVKVWRRVLTPQGRLLGIFFVTDKRDGPAFGGSEWEVRERLRKNFSFMYWTRWRRSVENRKGLELVVFAQKTSS